MKVQLIVLTQELFSTVWVSSATSRDLNLLVADETQKVENCTTVRIVNLAVVTKVQVP